MKIKLLTLAAILTIFALDAFAQNGGKAEPNRLQIAKGKTSVTVTGTLKGDEIAEFVFSAKEKQFVSVSVNSTKPKGKFHQFVIKGDGVDFESVQPRLEVEKFLAPATGDYLIFVSLASKKIKSGKFSLTLTIKNGGR